ncbi:MAG: hypothetical protein M1828_000414 [Chrysothrix sp. TS-e1954]|nr:MAG: hypothetical protein M1828_000414 [Chrysothrix sp. TS-e1954]
MAEAANKVNGTADTDEPTYDETIVDIARYVHNFEAHSDLAWEQAEVTLLDSMGCAMETLALSPMCRKLLGPTVPGTIVPNGFKLPGTSYVLDPVTGAFNLGAMIRFLDHSDAFMGAEWGHPSDNIGGVLSTLDYLSRAGTSSNGPPATVGTLLSAVMKSYDVQGVYQHLNSFNAIGIDQVILVKLASAGVCSWLLGNTEEQTRAVLSHVWMDGHPLRTYRHYPNAGPRKGWAGGDASARGVQLALLVGRGQEGAPTVLSDPKWGFTARTFNDKPFKFNQALESKCIELIFRKPMPAEGHALTAIESTAVAYEQAAEKQGLKNAVEDIKEIKVKTFKAAMVIIDKKGPLRNFAARDHCLQYMMAVTILKAGAPMEAPDYEDDSPFASDPRVDSLRDKIVLEEVPEYTADYLDADKRLTSSSVTFVMQNGEEVGGVMFGDALGSPRRNDTKDHIRMKARRNLGRVFGEERVDAIFNAVEGKGAREGKVSDFVDLFVPEDRDFTKEIEKVNGQL